jgi:hypothetical protein
VEAFTGDCLYDPCPGCPVAELALSDRNRAARAVRRVLDSQRKNPRHPDVALPPLRTTKLVRRVVGNAIDDVPITTAAIGAVELNDKGECVVEEPEENTLIVERDN